MNLTVKNLKISFAALLTGAALSSQVFAQAVSTPIVGFQTKTLSTGLNSVGLPLLNPDTIKTTVTSVSGSNIALSGASSLGASLEATKSYYLEVYSGSLKGDRFDLNTAATIAAAPGTAVLESSSINNTYPVSSISSALNNETVAIRPHLTLTDFDTMCSPRLVGNNSVASADSVGFTESGSIVYFYKKLDGTWRRVGSAADFSSKTIPPGVGVIVRKASGTSTTTQTGTVRDNDFARPYSSGLSLIASGFPLDRTPTGVGVTPGIGTTDWFGGTIATGDSISVVSSGALVRYVLRTDGSMVRVGNPGDFKNSEILAGADAQLVKRTRANSDNVEVDPIN